MTMQQTRRLLDLLEIDVPIIQAPMAGVSSPAMAVAAANAGGLGSIGVGAADAVGARVMIEAVRAATRRSLNVNVFCHRPARPDPKIDAAWLERLRPEFEKLGAAPPATLQPLYRSFLEDDAMLAVLLEARRSCASFRPAR
jgi:nitronate monooxygenase